MIEAPYGGEFYERAAPTPINMKTATMENNACDIDWTLGPNFNKIVLHRIYFQSKLASKPMSSISHKKSPLMAASSD